MIIDKLKNLINKYKNKKEVKKILNREGKNAYKRQWRKEHPEESKRLDKKYKENRKKKKNKKEENKEMPTGVYGQFKEWSKREKDALMLLKSQYGRDYGKIREILNEASGNNRTINSVKTKITVLTKKQREEGNKMPTGVYERKPKDEGKENILHTAIEFLEKKKENKDIDVNLINGWQGDIKTLGDAITASLNEAFEKKNKPIRKVWAIRIKSIDKEEINQYGEMLNETMNRGKTIFSKATLGISELPEVNYKKKDKV